VIWLAYQVMFFFGFYIVFPVLSIIAAVLAYGFIFWGAGQGAGKGTNLFSRVTSNRSPALASIIAVLGAIGAVLVLRVLLVDLMMLIPLEVLQDTGEFLGRNAWYTWLIYGIGGCLAMLLAAISSSTQIMESKYCETCHRFHQKRLLKQVSFGQAQVLAHLAHGDHGESVVDFLPQMHGNFAETYLHECDRCHEGFLEVDVEWNYEFPGDNGGTNSETESWRPVSVALTAEDIRELQG